MCPCRPARPWGPARPETQKGEGQAEGAGRGPTFTPAQPPLLGGPRTCAPSCPRLPGSPLGPWGEQIMSASRGAYGVEAPMGAPAPKARCWLRPPQLITLTLSPLSPRGPAAPGAPVLPCAVTVTVPSVLGMCPPEWPPTPKCSQTYIRPRGAGQPHGSWGAGGSCKESEGTWLITVPSQSCCLEGGDGGELTHRPHGPRGASGPHDAPGCFGEGVGEERVSCRTGQGGAVGDDPPVLGGFGCSAGVQPPPPQNPQPHPYLGQSTRVRLAPWEQEARGDRGGRATPFLQGDPWLHRGQGDRGDLGDLQGERCG